LQSFKADESAFFRQSKKTAEFMNGGYPELTAEEAAALIGHGQVIGFSGFTSAGAAKAVPPALAKRAQTEHEAGRPFQVGVITGASTGPLLDGKLAEAGAILFRTPYQSDPALRRSINAGQTRFFDMHLSMVPQAIRYGFLGKLDWAVVEAASLNSSGEIVLTTSVGASPTFCRTAERILIELNDTVPPDWRGFHDIYEPADPPMRREIPVYAPSDRIGREVVQVDPRKIAGIVRASRRDEGASFVPETAIHRKIGENVAEFLTGELKAGRIPRGFLPVQTGVGNMANAVLETMASHPSLPQFSMYSEVIQDAAIRLLRKEKIRFASGTALTLSPDMMRGVYDDLEFFRRRLLLRPQEITNHPEVVRRLGLISVNTALEIDLSGNVNSTHMLGKQLMNGIGGSGDFTRNAYLSIFTCASAVKNGAISTIVPFVTHADHNEHSVQVVVTEQGVADLRGKTPHERAALIVDRCAHPDYREMLHGYFDQVQDGQTPQTLAAAFAMHRQLAATGSMRGTDWAKYF
jgi:succinate CoA transferase